MAEQGTYPRRSRRTPLHLPTQAVRGRQLGAGSDLLRLRERLSGARRSSVASPPARGNRSRYCPWRWTPGSPPSPPSTGVEESNRADALGFPTVPGIHEAASRTVAIDLAGPSTACSGRGSAAARGYSTAADLARFVQALRDRKIPGGPPPGIGIAGGAPGINAVMEGDLPGGYDLVVLTNLDPPAAMKVAGMVRDWLGAGDE